MDSIGIGTHTQRMDTALISAFSALGGSIIGGLTSGFTNWLSLRSQARTTHRMHRVAQREDLYRDFIIAASTLYADAVLNSEPKVQDIVVLYGMISRMRVLSSSKVVACAEKTLDLLIEAKFSEKQTVREHRALMKSGETIDPLKEFSEVTRDELRAF